jgi:hypothetical protein
VLKRLASQTEDALAVLLARRRADSNPQSLPMRDLCGTVAVALEKGYSQHIWLATDARDLGSSKYGVK